VAGSCPSTSQSLDEVYVLPRSYPSGYPGIKVCDPLLLFRDLFGDPNETSNLKCILILKMDFHVGAPENIEANHGIFGASVSLWMLKISRNPG
jgi:hypothetical protein